MKKRIISVLLVVLLLLAPTVMVEAATVDLPAQGTAPNLAQASTLTLTHTHAATYPNKVATYDASTDAITMTGNGVGSSVAYTTAPAVLAGTNYVLSFKTQTKGWSNDWKLTAQFANDNGISQSIIVCDKYVAYIDAAGMEHQLADTATNSAIKTFSVFVRQEANNTCGIYIYVGGVLKGEFHKQQALTPTLRFTGPNANTSWTPVISELAMYASAELYGDVDGNGIVGANDPAVLAKYLAGWSGFEDTVNLANADVDQDGQVTPLDVAVLYRQKSHWKGYGEAGQPYVPTIVVTDRGVKNDGSVDVTAQLTALHATGKKIYYPNGTYLFNGNTLDFSGGVEFESADGVIIRNSISDTPIVNFDDNGNLIGLMHNHLETKFKKMVLSTATSGNLVSPPISTANYDTKVDFLPYWYNDFGLYTRRATGAGSIAWYDWSWNHHMNTKTPTFYITRTVGYGSSETKSEYSFTTNTTVSNIAVYQPTGSNPTVRPSSVTTYSNLTIEPVSTTSNGKVMYKANSLNQSLSGKTYESTYAVQFTTSRPAEWSSDEVVTFSTADREDFFITSTGVTYLKTALTYAQSGLATSDSITYTVYLQYNNDNATRTVSIYANGQQMLKSDGTPATFQSTIYDDDLHPLLGWYRGDEPVVLDWQCYWLREHGVNQTILIDQDGWDATKWTTSTDADYWIYQLLNNTPNAKHMDFALQFDARSYSATEESLWTSWETVMNNFYFNSAYKDMVYCYEKGGKRYPVVFLWDEKSIRLSLDGSTSATQTAMPNLQALYKRVADAFIDNGYGGVCFLARNACASNHVAALNSNNVMWFAADYSTGSGSTYADRVNNFTTASSVNKVYAVATGANTHGPHPSQWYCPGSTPALFGQWVKKAVQYTTANTARPQMITCYNVSEWSEGGPGLVPTVGNNFGYLEAIRDNIVIK